MILDDYTRVSRHQPCPCCGKRDWCLVAKDGHAAVCARHESQRRFGQAGWLHVIDAAKAAYRPRTWTVEAPQQDFTKDADGWHAAAVPYLDRLASHLHLGLPGLRLLRVGYFRRERCMTWPLSDDRGRVIGIVRRYADGTKRIMPGHRAGLYLPVQLPDEPHLYVTEGGTDTAAALDIGLPAVGRFACLSGWKLLRRLLRRRTERFGPHRIVIVADADGPGRRGAMKLAGSVRPFVASVAVIEPPAPYMDLREWTAAGATRHDIEGRCHGARSD